MTRALLLLLLTSLSSVGGTLYATDFEEFTAGDNQWGGANGWISNDASSGAQGIIQDPVTDLPLGRTAYLGFEKPANSLTTVFRSVNHDPAASEFPRIQFESLLGIQDSTNGRRDLFHLSFFNIDGDFLAALTFDNTTGSVTSDDGTQIHDTGVPFLRGDQTPGFGVAALQLLEISIELDVNLWSASLDAIPLFARTFTASGKTLDLGAIAVEWEIPSGEPEMAGNNWLLIADWLVASIPRGKFSILGIERDEAGTATVRWPGHPGFDYQVSYSPDLLEWFDDLPGSMIEGNATDGPLSLSDSDTSLRPQRYYRVRRRPTF